MCHLALGLLFLVCSVTVLAADPLQDAQSLKLDIFSFQPLPAQEQKSDRRHASYRLSASVILTNAPDFQGNGFVSSGIPLGSSMIEMQRETTGAERRNFGFSSAGNRPHLAALLSFGSEQQKLVIKPRRHSLSIQYTQVFY